MGPGERLERVREVPVADPVRLAVLEAPARVPDRRLGAPEDGVDARDLPLATGEVRRRALLGLAPVVARRVRDVQQPVVILAALHQAPGLVEEVYAALPLLAHSSGASATERSRISSTTVGSASVVVSPSGRFSATSRRRRRMILPLRVLGSSGVNTMFAGFAIGPIFVATWLRSVSSSSTVPSTPLFRVTKATIACPVSASLRAATAASATS